MESCPISSVVLWWVSEYRFYCTAAVSMEVPWYLISGHNGGSVLNTVN
jgi:hypothetical protein